MCCILCYNSLILNLHVNIQVRRSLITYKTINGIIALRKHVNENHCNI